MSKETLKANLREIPDFPIPGILFYDVTTPVSYTHLVKMPDIKKKETTGWIKEVAACYGKRVGEIAYIFCSDDKILEVNRPVSYTHLLATSSAESCFAFVRKVNSRLSSSS